MQKHTGGITYLETPQNPPGEAKGHGWIFLGCCQRDLDLCKHWITKGWMQTPVYSMKVDMLHIHYFLPYITGTVILTSDLYVGTGHKMVALESFNNLILQILVDWILRHWFIG